MARMLTTIIYAFRYVFQGGAVANEWLRIVNKELKEIGEKYNG